MNVNVHDHTRPISVKVNSYPKREGEKGSFDLWTVEFHSGHSEVSLLYRDPVRLKQVVKDLYEQVLKLEA